LESYLAGNSSNTISSPSFYLIEEDKQIIFIQNYTDSRVKLSK
jgi:hypothetical protein